MQINIAEIFRSSPAHLLKTGWSTLDTISIYRDRFRNFQANGTTSSHVNGLGLKWSIRLEVQFF